MKWGTHVLLGGHLDPEETVGERVDDDVRLVELRDNRVRLVVLGVLRPDNVHQVIADMAFLFERNHQRRTNN